LGEAQAAGFNTVRSAHLDASDATANAGT